MAEILNFEGEPEVEPNVDAGAVGVALALDGARHDPGLRDNIAHFLTRQEEFLDEQRHHLHEQRHHMKLKHVSERLKVMWQLLILVVGLGIIGALGWAAVSAYNDHSLVIEGLGVPPDLVTQGSTGAALSGQLQDRLAALQEETVSKETAAEVRRQKPAGIKIEIPETGVSVTEISEMLRAWLGHETRVVGDISHVTSGPDAGGLALDLRVGATPGVRLVQADADVEALMRKGGEQIYAATQPFRYIQWLDEHGRTPEAVALDRDLAQSHDPAVRAQSLYQLNLMTAQQISPQDAEVIGRQAVDLDLGVKTPGRMRIVSDTVTLGVIEQTLGRWQEAYRLFTLGLKRAPFKTARGAVLDNNIIGQTDQDYMLGQDKPLYLCTLYAVSPCSGDGIADAVRTSQVGAQKTDYRMPERVFIAAKKVADGHDPSGAARMLAAPLPVSANRSAAFYSLVEADRQTAVIHLDTERQDWAKVVEDGKTWTAFAALWPGLQYPDAPPLQQALALAQLNRASEGEVILTTTAADCYPCLTMRGRVAAVQRRWAEAEGWFAQAAKQGPSLPFADTWWGAMLLAKGDTPGAIAHLEQAIKLGPQDADPMELLGEALMDKNRPGDAMAQFKKAAELTPKWGRLHLKWGEALAKAGKTDEAKAQFQQARGLFLAPADRAELAAQRL